MLKIYSNVESDKLLHIINRFEDISQRTDIIPDNNFLQLATLKMNQGKTFRGHKHIWKPSTTPDVIAQESWVVIQGSVKVYFYDIDNKLILTEVLNKGDCSVTLEGGHNYEILQDDTVVYEYKTGPYFGQENDKVFLDD